MATKVLKKAMRRSVSLVASKAWAQLGSMAWHASKQHCNRCAPQESSQPAEGLLHDGRKLASKVLPRLPKPAPRARHPPFA
jgi:hypothetical protein